MAKTRLAQSKYIKRVHSTPSKKGDNHAESPMTRYMRDNRIFSPIETSQMHETPSNVEERTSHNRLSTPVRRHPTLTGLLSMARTPHNNPMKKACRRNLDFVPAQSTITSAEMASSNSFDNVELLLEEDLQHNTSGVSSLDTDPAIMSMAPKHIIPLSPGLSSDTESDANRFHESGDILEETHPRTQTQYEDSSYTHASPNLVLTWSVKKTNVESLHDHKIQLPSLSTQQQLTSAAVK